MVTLHYEKIIHAPVQKVWDLLWNPETYPQWTKFFTNRNIKTDWEINGKTYFLDENGNGMVSTIKSLNEPFEIVFSHLGVLKDGVEDLKSQPLEEISGMEEKYFLRAVNDTTTELRAITHTMREYEEHLGEGFNKGFDILKNMAENSEKTTFEGD